jgi:dynactin complex subunit
VSSNYPPSDISGGSANSFDRHLSAAKLQELLDEMKRQGMEISLLKQQLAEVSPTNDGSLARQAERSAKEAEAQRRRAEAFRKQLFRARSGAESGPS